MNHLNVTVSKIMLMYMQSVVAILKSHVTVGKAKIKKFKCV